MEVRLSTLLRGPDLDKHAVGEVGVKGRGVVGDLCIIETGDDEQWSLSLKLAISRENDGTEREAPGTVLGICHVHESYF